MAFNEQCDMETVIPFDGYIVYDQNDVRWWMGTNEDGLKIFIATYKERGVAIEDFRIFKGKEFIETVGEYMERNIKEFKKYRCEVALSANEESTGVVYLTADEYWAVKYATNTENWKERSLSTWSGAFNIYCEELENPGVKMEGDSDD